MGQPWHQLRDTQVQPSITLTASSGSPCPRIQQSTQGPQPPASNGRLAYTVIGDIMKLPQVCSMKKDRSFIRRAGRYLHGKLCHESSDLKPLCTGKHLPTISQMQPHKDISTSPGHRIIQWPLVTRVNEWEQEGSSCQGWCISNMPSGKAGT